jgi:hypothetical protein
MLVFSAPGSTIAARSETSDSICKLSKVVLPLWRLRLAHGSHLRWPTRLDVQWHLRAFRSACASRSHLAGQGTFHVFVLGPKGACVASAGVIGCVDSAIWGDLRCYSIWSPVAPLLGTKLLAGTLLTRLAALSQAASG